jgi:hypothetical protein
MALLLLTTSLVFFPTAAHAMGKKYSKQGAALTRAMNYALFERGLCKNPQECDARLPGTMETDTEIAISLFEVQEKNQAAFLTIVALALSEGMRITGGIPISINAFRESQEAHRKSGLFIKDIKPFAVIEVKK